MRIVLSAALVCSLFGCGKKKEGGDTSSTKTTETKPAEPATPAEKPADPGAPPPAAPAANGASVDTCAFASKEELEKLLGGKLLGDPTKQNANGSMLGSCMWVTDAGFSGTVSARPASEYEATAGMDKAAKDLTAGEKAKMTKYGALVQPAGKPYFMQVMVMNAGTAKLDEAKTTELSKLVANNAK